jgi:hypothetical protein
VETVPRHLPGAEQPGENNKRRAECLEQMAANHALAVNTNTPLAWNCWDRVRDPVPAEETIHHVHRQLEAQGNPGPTFPNPPSFPDPAAGPIAAASAHAAAPAAAVTAPAAPASASAPAGLTSRLVSHAGAPSGTPSSAAPVSSGSAGHIRFGPCPVFNNDDKLSVREWLRVMQLNSEVQRIGMLHAPDAETPDQRTAREQAQEMARIKWATTFLKPGNVTQRWHAETAALERAGTPITTWASFTKHFARVFGALNPESTARNEIHMPQGARPIHEWASFLYDKFAELESLGVPMDGPAQLFVLQRFMNRGLYDKIVLTQPSRKWTNAREILEEAKAYAERVRDTYPNDKPRNSSFKPRLQAVNTGKKSLQVRAQEMKVRAQNFNTRANTGGSAGPGPSGTGRRPASSQSEREQAVNEAERVLRHKITKDTVFPDTKCPLSANLRDALYDHMYSLCPKGSAGSRLFCWNCKNHEHWPQSHHHNSCKKPILRPFTQGH